MLQISIHWLPTQNSQWHAWGKNQENSAKSRNVGMSEMAVKKLTCSHQNILFLVYWLIFHFLNSFFIEE
jgi:hypothetical protein